MRQRSVTNFTNGRAASAGVTIRDLPAPPPRFGGASTTSFVRHGSVSDNPEHPARAGDSLATRVATADGARALLTDRPPRGPTLTASDPAVALLAVAQRALGVPFVRLAASRDCTIAGAATDARAWFPANDPVGEALVAEVHAVGGALLIEDTRAAPPFRGTVVLDGMRAMACLAVPLRDTTGRTVAVVCALDGVPRWWTDQDAKLLGAIATALAALALTDAAPASAETRASAVTAAPAPTIAPAPAVPEPPAADERPVASPVAEAAPPSVNEPLAQLTGGIAHNFNNQLTIIAANAELLRDTLRQLDGPDVVRAGAHEEVDAILRAADTASEITWQLLAYGRTLPLAPERLDVHERLTALEPRLRETCGPHITLELTLAAPRPILTMDPAQFDHVLLELLDNARHAMPNGGRVCVRTERVLLDDTRRGTPDDVPIGPWVVLSVIDAGVGVAADALPQLFRPFFTTREVGRGLGLALAAVHGIIAQSAGYCTIDSVVGQGTTVRLWMPEPTR
jgi:signal transduction histidine kinase